MTDNAKPKKPLGRPIVGNFKAGDRLYVRISTEDKTEVAQAAEIAGMSTGEFIRNAAIKAAKSTIDRAEKRKKKPAKKAG